MISDKISLQLLGLTVLIGFWGAVIAYRISNGANRIIKAIEQLRKDHP